MKTDDLKINLNLENLNKLKIKKNSHFKKIFKNYQIKIIIFKIKYK